jgi:hypothetical protein
MSTIISKLCGTTFLRKIGFFKEQSKHYQGLQS